MFCTRDHEFVAGSKTLTSATPCSVLSSTSPPMVSTLPLGITTWPAHQSCVPVGTCVICDVAQFSTAAPDPLSKKSTFVVPGNTTACITTVDPLDVTGDDHAPVAARGSGGAVGPAGVSAPWIGTHAAARIPTTAKIV